MLFTVAKEASDVMLSPDADDDEDENHASTSTQEHREPTMRAPILLPGLGEISNKPKV